MQFVDPEFTYGRYSKLLAMSSDQAGKLYWNFCNGLTDETGQERDEEKLVAHEC